MAIAVRRLNPRRRSKRELLHKPSGSGQGKWHSRSVLWRWYRKRRRKNRIAAESRRRNRA